MSFDLLRVPDGYEADLVLVIAPYFDPNFAKKMVARLAPRRIYYLVDDGSRNEEIDELRKSLPRSSKNQTKKTEVKIALGGSTGLVHIKGIYIESVLMGGQRKRGHRRFLFGSANATMAAFGGKNAELIADVELSLGLDADLLDYLAEVAEAIKSNSGGMVNARKINSLSNSPALYMPAFKISEAGPPPGFDAWLQRGRLAAKYRDANGFLTATVRLKSTLPPGLLTDTFKAHRLIELGERDQLRFAYIGDIEPAETDEPAEAGEPTKTEKKSAALRQWNARFGTWSHLGNWLSDTCHKEHRKKLIGARTEDRKAKLAVILENGDDPEWQAERRGDLLRSLDSVWQDFTNSKLAKPDDYLVSNDQGLNRSHYEEKFDRKFKTDLLLAKDEDFRDRYVTGYDFPNVPKFRQDQKAWNSFALSICRSIAVEAAKSGSISMMTKAVASAFQAVGARLIDFEDIEILNWLRKYWEHMIEIDDNVVTVGEHITQYWKEKPKKRQPAC